MPPTRTGIESASIEIQSRSIRPARPIRSVDEPGTSEPDALRDAVYEALSSLSLELRREISAKLIAALKQAGLRVHECLFMLGVPAKTVDELTAPEIAALIRYVRITEPKAMTAVVPPVIELLTLAEAENGLFVP
jgi:hypothetical protein